MSDSITAAMSAKDHYEQTVAMLAADDRLTPAGKHDAADAAREQLSVTLARLEAEHTDQQSRRLAGLRSRVYGPPKGDHDGHRSALDRARATADNDELAELFHMAALTGDETQQHAAFVIADQRQAGAVVAAYLEQRASARQAYADLYDAEHPDVLSPEGLQRAAAFTMPPTPHFN